MRFRLFITKTAFVSFLAGLGIMLIPLAIGSLSLRQLKLINEHPELRTYLSLQSELHGMKSRLFMLNIKATSVDLELEKRVKNEMAAYESIYPNVNGLAQQMHSIEDDYESLVFCGWILGFPLVIISILVVSRFDPTSQSNNKENGDE